MLNQANIIKIIMGPTVTRHKMGVIKIVLLTTFQIMALSQMKNEGLGMVKTPQIKFVKIATGRGTHKKGAGLWRGDLDYERDKSDVVKKRGKVGFCKVSKPNNDLDSLRSVIGQ